MLIVFIICSVVTSKRILSYHDPKQIPHTDIFSDALNDYKEILLFTTGSSIIPETLQVSKDHFIPSENPTTARDHLLKFLQQRIIRNIADDQRKISIGDESIAHYKSAIHLHIAEQMGDPIAQLISGFRKSIGVNSEKDCEASFDLYKKALKKDMWYDSEFEMAFQYPDFLPSTYAYAHTSIPSLFSKFITSITQPFESILRFDTLSSTELINAGKILYRLGYKDQIIYDMFVRAGEMGDNNGNVLAAIMKEYGWGVEKNTTNAAEMYFNSLDHVASATTRIGLMFLDPNSPIGYSQEEGASRLDKAGYSGHIDAFLHLSLLFNNRSFVQYNTTRASIYRQNVLLNDGNNGKALYNYALIHQDNSTMVDCQTAVTFMQINLWKTNVYMQLLNELAQRYYKAELFESALNLYQFLSELGFFNAQLNAGLMLESGIGCEHVSKDLRMKKALSLYESAVKVESNNLIWSNLIKNIPGLNGVSYVRLASMYYHGNGINQSMSNAIYWYKMGMKSNNPEAYFMLGFISQYKIDVRDEFTLDSPDNYYTKLMDIRGYSIVGYLMFLNYKVEVFLSSLSFLSFCLFILIVVLYFIQKIAKSNKQPQSGSVNDL